MISPTMWACAGMIRRKTKSHTSHGIQFIRSVTLHGYELHYAGNVPLNFSRGSEGERTSLRCQMRNRPSIGYI